MTRFARAEGSKSSNKRVPDEATPWHTLKTTATCSSADVARNAKNSPNKKIKWKGMNSEHLEEFTDTSGHAKMKRKEYKRRKPLSDYPSFVKDGKEINIVRFEGFPVRKEDAEKLKKLKKELLASKVSHAEIKKRMKLERRRAEKALARDRKIICFHCRQSGHMLSQCPNLENEDHVLEAGICFKCGSTEHQHTQCQTIKGDNYKFATCFICKEEGHVSKQCPDNPRGLYPQGGACRLCGDVTHLKKDCPKFGKKKKEEFDVTVPTLDSRSVEALDSDTQETEPLVPQKKKRKVIKM